MKHLSKSCIECSRKAPRGAPFNRAVTFPLMSLFWNLLPLRKVCPLEITKRSARSRSDECEGRLITPRLARKRCHKAEWAGAFSWERNHVSLCRNCGLILIIWIHCSPFPLVVFLSYPCLYGKVMNFVSIFGSCSESLWFSAIIFISTSYSDVLFQDRFEILKTHLQEWCVCERVVWCGVSGWGLHLLLFREAVRCKPRRTCRFPSLHEWSHQFSAGLHAVDSPSICGSFRGLWHFVIVSVLCAVDYRTFLVSPARPSCEMKHNLHKQFEAFCLLVSLFSRVLNKTWSLSAAP